MATGAKIRSLDALEAFRASLIVFATRARRAVDQVGEEVARTRQWVEHDRRMHWTEQLRRRSRALAQAQQEMFSAKLSTMGTSKARQEQLLRRAKEEMDEAELKLRNVKAWSRDFDRFADPLVRKLDVMRHYLEHVVPRAVAHLESAQRILESYAATPPPPSAPLPPADPAGNP